MIEIPLDLPEVPILNTEHSERGIVIAVESAREWAVCAECGGEIREFHSCGWGEYLRGMPVPGRPVIIEIRSKRFQCQICEVNSTQKLNWYGEGDSHTVAYEHWLLLQSIDSAISIVISKQELPYDTAPVALYLRLTAAVDWEMIKQLRTLRCSRNRLDDKGT
jgi:hypothetical protein